MRVSVDRARARGSNELRVRLRSVAAAGPAVAASRRVPELQVVSQLSRGEQPPRQRSQEISPDHLVIVLLDDSGTVRDSQIVIDPRLVRGEFPDAEGNLHKTTIYRDDVEFGVTFADLPEAAEIRVFSPQFEDGVKLVPLATVRLARAVRQ